MNITDTQIQTARLSSAWEPLRSDMSDEFGQSAGSALV
jgi:hypothetical protein